MIEPASGAMARPVRGTPGTATVAELARHWVVSSPTVRAILEQAGLPDVAEGGWPKYRWDDVWRLEGAGFVPPCDWADFKAPMLGAGDLAAIDPRGRAARTWRRHVACGRLPSVRLSPGIRRVRACVFDVMVSRV